uniref:Ras homolog family member F, filopodia associated n=1 Tax=Paramormyrops kingsleyae TaxID=1676925 RepID=A0A3B3QNH4_9TELE
TDQVRSRETQISLQNTPAGVTHLFPVRPHTAHRLTQQQKDTPDGAEDPHGSTRKSQHGDRRRRWLREDVPAHGVLQERLLGGQEDYDRLRPLSYPDANLVFICYDVTNPTSFENVLLKWYPEVHHFCRGLPILLIGCKTDLRKNKEQTRKLRALGLAPITYLQGVEAMRQMKAELYLECSAKYQENVMDIFREAVKRGLTATQRARQARRKANFCTML